jgi:hypothetical protein
MKTWICAVIAMLGMSSAFAATLGVTSRHNESGTVGPNGVKQHIALKIAKDGTLLKDSGLIQVDLGEHKYPSVKPDALVNPAAVDATTGASIYRPRIILTLGTTVVLNGQSDAKGKIVGDFFTGKLINNGAGIKIQIKKATLSALLSGLSGVGEHGLLAVKIEDNHPEAPAASAAAAPRHAGAIFDATFEVDVDENTKKLTAKG